MSHLVSPEHIQAENRRYYTFINLAFILAVITGVEIVIIFLPIPKGIIVASLIILSVIKFIGVILWFMHLIYDKFLLTLLFFVGLIIAVGITAALLLLLGPEDIAEPVEITALYESISTTS